MRLLVGGGMALVVLSVIVTLANVVPVWLGGVIFLAGALLAGYGIQPNRQHPEANKVE